MNSLRRVRATNVGIDLANVLLVQPSLDVAGLDTSRSRFILNLGLERVRHLRGVAHATLASNTVPKVSSFSMDFEIPGRTSLPSLPNGGPYVNVCLLYT